jgi:hypothetical protein
VYGVKLDMTSRAGVVNAMKKSQAHFGIAAAIVSMFAALTVPAADGRRVEPNLRFTDTQAAGASLQVYCQPGFFATYRWCATGVPTFEELALFYNVDFGRRVDISRSAECKYHTPAGGLAYWIDDDILSLSMQPAERFEIPPDELRAFVQECDDAAEPEERLTAL